MEKKSEDFFNKVKQCSNCSLRDSIYPPVVYRGSLNSKIMLVSEAPGKQEQESQVIFSGPAGQLLEKILNSINISFNDILLTNACYCRPTAPEGSGKQNITPDWEQITTCQNYLKEFIELVEPKIIIACGRTALSSLFDDPKARLGDFEGTWTYYKQNDTKDINMFVMLHPSAILHLSKWPDKQQETKLKVWNYMQFFRDSYKAMLEGK